MALNSFASSRTAAALIVPGIVDAGPTAQDIRLQGERIAAPASQQIDTAITTDAAIVNLPAGTGMQREQVACDPAYVGRAERGRTG